MHGHISLKELKMEICGRSLADSPRGHACLRLLIVVCCQVEVSASG